MRILLSFLLLIFGFQISFAQEKPKALLIDEFGKTCSEDVMLRYDNFHFGVLNNFNSIGYIVFYGDEANEGRNLSYIYWLANYYKGRVNANNIIRGANRKSEIIQFWLVPQGAEIPKPITEFVPTEITKPTLFDSVRADFHRWYGELDIYDAGFYDLGCDFPPNQIEFAKILRSNPNLAGRLVIFNSNKNRADRVAKFAIKELTKTYKVSPKLLTTIYGGKSKEPKIEFWLIPKRIK